LATSTTLLDWLTLFATVAVIGAGVGVRASQLNSDQIARRSTRQGRAQRQSRSVCAVRQRLAAGW
jgi:hypothetical protein